MNKSQRIYFSTGNSSNNFNQDKYIKVRLEQNVDTLEFLSMSLGTSDVYQNFNADYGVLIGRVLANGGVGIPNAKISIFIPLSDEDAQNSEVYGIYPYKTPRDKNNEGKRYNLLPRVSRIDPKTNEVIPKQPFGSFPIKEEIVTNEPFLNVYKKYYKYTALTNTSGDYMIFGVPTGTQTVHLSVDITDIGEYGMTPAAMVTNLGYSPNLFTDNNTRIKSSQDLNDLPNIETQEISVDIVPFWGDVENFEIGITRQDFRIRSVLTNTFTIFGSAFTDGENSMWGGDSSDYTDEKISELYHISGDNRKNIGMVTKRIGTVTEKIYYYSPNVSDEDINNGNVDPEKDMRVLDPTEYSAYKRNGDFVFIISCNRNKVVTDELGNKVPVDNDSSIGIYTEFSGFITLEITTEDVPLNTRGTIGNDVDLSVVRYKFKFPQHADEGRGLRKDNYDAQAPVDVQNWRKQYYSFSGGNFYSVARFHGVVQNKNSDNDDVNKFGSHHNSAFSNKDGINDPYQKSPEWYTGLIETTDYGYTGNTQYGMVSNSQYTNSQLKYFGANWLNFAIHLPQSAYVTNGYNYIENWRSNTNFTHVFKETYYMGDNSQKIAGSDFNTKFMARSDLHWTDFIQVPKEDINEINNYKIKKGFTKTDIGGLTGNYRNGSYIPASWTAACPLRGGKKNGDADNSLTDPETYFYKGFDTADCIDYLYLLGLL